MATRTSPITYTETEIRSLLPSGWGLAAGSFGRWDAEKGGWSVEIVDGAENRWTVAVEDESVAKLGRLPALDGQIRRLERKALGRKSVISG